MIARKTMCRMSRGGVLALSLVAITQLGVVAQGDFPAAPDPALCQVEPRTLDDIAALFAGATPVAEYEQLATAEIPLGYPADDAAVAGITGAINQAAACLNAGDMLRFFALLTDHAIVTSFPWIVEAITAGGMPPVQPLPPDQRQTVLAIGSVMRLDDGRVGGILTVADPASEAYPGADSLFVIVTSTANAWLIDEIIEFG